MRTGRVRKRPSSASLPIPQRDIRGLSGDGGGGQVIPSPKGLKPADEIVDRAARAVVARTGVGVALAGARIRIARLPRWFKRAYLAGSLITGGLLALPLWSNRQDVPPRWILGAVWTVSLFGALWPLSWLVFLLGFACYVVMLHTTL